MNRLAGSALIAAMAIAAPALAADRCGETERNRAIVAGFARIFYRDRDVSRAFASYVAPDYIQHNPNIADGREAAIAALKPIFDAPGSRFDVKRILVDGDMAVIHLRGRSGPEGRGGAVADIYRLRGGKIVEHWDVLQTVPDHAANAHSMF